jgi:hypothetical protein
MMNAQAKRRRSVSKAPRQESATEAGSQESAGAERPEAALPAEGSVILGDHLPADAFVRLSVPESEKYLPCNPSIAKDGDGNLACLLRTVNYELGEEDGIWFRGDPAPNTRNYFVTLDADAKQKSVEWVDDLQVRQNRLPARDGLEDARLFWFDGAWQFTCSALHHGPRVRTTMALAKLNKTHIDRFEFLHSPHTREMEKNWMPCVNGTRLAFVYSHHPAESFEIYPARTRIWLGAFPALQGWSGGSQIIPYNGEWLGVVHQRRKHKNRVHYVHRLVAYNANLEPVRAGREFYFKGEQIEFCAGIVEHGGHFILSFGVKDREAWLVKLTSTKIASLFV